MIVKSQCKTDYTKVSNAFIKNETLSINAKMVGILLLSLPNTWNVNVAYLAKTLSIGETTIRKAIRELIDNSFLKRIQGKTNGKFNEDMYYEFIDPQEEEIFIKEEEITEPKIIENLEFNHLLNQPLQQQEQDLAESLKEPKNNHSSRLIESPITENLSTYKDRIYYKKRESILRQSQKVINLSTLFIKPKKNLELDFKDFSDQELKSIQNFFNYRKEKHRNLCLSTKKSILDNLRKLKEQGEDIISIIQTSINRGWSGLFPKNKTTMPTYGFSSRKSLAKELAKDKQQQDKQDKELIMQHIGELSPENLAKYEQGKIVPLTIDAKVRYIQKEGDLVYFVA
ncbi:helix-turn-helix domain-containing protein [Helicobacter apodemus]|uniref:Helix-turn-helix domain-containing protein n=1 Tax=Helicobacter apodemus TaxID=135569 RepID=A0A4U8UBJ1_9HELI|nr:helix-turn-helix domain-containing protein [Helicobacter apodemus]TLE13753.1 helix-turn-helix domain-containing protein [Helicobacter apodemus]